jgi:polyhydroxybutyrate depolymerase
MSTRFRLVVALLSVGMIAAGCGTDDAAATCEPTVRPSVSMRTIATPDGEREYQLATPIPDGRSPLLFDFHGTGGDIATEDLITGLSTAGPERGYVVVTPQGLETPARWTVPGIPGPDDQEMVHLIIDDLAVDVCVDTSRIFVTGISSGASFSSLLACESPRIAGAAPVAGVNLARRCPQGDPVGLISFHGTDDGWVPYEAPPGWEDVEAEEGTYFRGGVEPNMEAWAERNGCDPEPVETRVGEETNRRDWQDCSAPTVLYTVTGGGHTWPGASEVVAESGVEDSVGYVTEDVDATTAMLDLFDATPSRR